MDLIEDIEMLDGEAPADDPSERGSQTAPRSRGGDGAPRSGGRVYIETYGCQMNVSDSEIVASVLTEEGYALVEDPAEADVVLLNTCAIRENAEERVRGRIGEFRALKHKGRPDLTLGVLGCMAERLREKLLEQEKLVDVVAGPDAYRQLPALLEEADRTGQAAVNVELSREETYADVAPVRYEGNGLSAYVSIMRGCDNMCTFCVVPFTRGRENSRPVTTVLSECSQLLEEGYREITVLGQNVNSYRYTSDGTTVAFHELLYRISRLSPELRIRYSTSHPKDCSEELMHVHAERHNVCDYIHLPVQHGNTEVLDRMRRTYSREEYLQRVEQLREIVPEVSLSTDVITGFCGETEEQHRDTLSLMREVRYDNAYMFAYSERPQTYAQKKFEDDVPEEVKKRRLREVIELQHGIQLARNRAEIGREHVVLVEGPSKKSDAQLCGRTDTNKMVVFDREEFEQGQYVRVRIEDCTKATLLGTGLEVTTLAEERDAVPA